MKKNRAFLQFTFCLVLTVFSHHVANGQVYKPGDLYIFEDGSRGIVFYVNPDNPASGTVAALHDLDGQFALWSGTRPQALAEVFAPTTGLSFRRITGWESHGKRSTQVLLESGTSPAADAIGTSGWYIPDAMQLYSLYASVAYLSGAFETYEGEITSLWTATHWSSTCVKNSTGNAYAINAFMKLENLSGTTAQYVRLVRDFPDTAEVQVFWVDNPQQTDTLVGPTATTSYDALAVCRADTLLLAATVTVHQPAADTLYETVSVSPQPYTSSVAPLFTALDISLPGNYEYNDTLQTVHGCDSLVTLLLTVVANTVYSDTLCPLKEDHYFAPFDTVFAAGTVSGVYEHHGTKIVDGLPVDTVAYYNLTILPEYQRFDTVSWCLYEPSETRQYEGDGHVSITVNGTAVTVTSDSEGIVVEEVTAAPGLSADFALRMQTVYGCDSVVFLHVDARRVPRGTVRYVVSEHQVEDGRVTLSGHTFEDITTAGVYELRDTLAAGNGCDSLVTLLLTVVSDAFYSDTLCPLKEDHYFAPFDTVFAAGTVSGVYEHHGTKTVDGLPVDTVAYYNLTILPEYQRFDTVSWCLYEPSETRQYEGDGHVSIAVTGTAVTVTSDSEGIVVEEVTAAPGLSADFALRMQTVYGCDSVVFLHVDARRVPRDTVRYVVSEHQVEDGRVTLSGHSFEDITTAGVYELRDTLAAGNGCDSLVTLLLTVVSDAFYSDTLCPLKENYYFAPFDTVFAAGTVTGVYEHRGTKTVEGLPVDTVAYYDLTILPEYQRFDTVSWCLYEPSEARPYEGNEHVSITVSGTAVIVASDSEEIVVEEVASVPGLVADFALQMQTVGGCDSVVFLHVDARRVPRDTVRYVVSEHQVEDGRVTLSGHTFEDITAAGAYELRDTLAAGNGCDSLVTLLLTVVANTVYSDTLCPLKEDHYFAPFDTVFAAGTVTGVYEHHGTKMVDGVPVDTVAYYNLTILPEYQRFDTVGWCLYEPSEARPYEGDGHVSIAVSGTAVTVTSDSEGIVVEEVTAAPGLSADFALRMHTVYGCDSVVFLHVDARRVPRDTVRYVISEHQVEDGRVTLSGHTFEDITAAGVYELRDTLAAGNGCDSLVTLLLTVVANTVYSDTLCPLKEDYYFAPFDTVFAAGTVTGVYEHHGTKMVDGVPVDTVAYYNLTILPEYQRFDTVSWCMYEPSEARPYEGDGHVTIAVSGTAVTVTSDSEEIVVEEVASVPGLAADFALRMQTVGGCDSVVFLHVDARRVERDTVRHVISEHQVEDGRVTLSGHTFEDITAAGVYELRDTLAAGNGCDSLVTLLLTVVANTVYSDTLCPLKEDYYFAPFDTVFAAGTVTGVYEHHGTKTVDGLPVDTVAYYNLTILPEYQRFDTVGWCMYEPSEARPYEGDGHVTITVSGTAVTVTSDAEGIVVDEVTALPDGTADFALRMHTVYGCDSVVFLHVDARRVPRDTVRYVISEHQVEDGRVTLSGHTFEDITAAGAYELRDTLAAGNGCDSLVTLLLTVVANTVYSDTLCPLKEDYYFAPFDTVFAAGTVTGVYEHHGTKTVDGVPVDTVAYYNLTILPEYQRFDTVSWCMYEPSEARPYEGDGHVTIAVSGTAVTVTSDSEGIVVEEVTAAPGLSADFALRMHTVYGCDSVVFLHVDARRVPRDTVRYVISEHQVEDGRVTLSGHTFEDITAAGAYELRDTLAAGNGCDSLVVYELTVTPCVSDFSIACPPDVHDTLAYGDCVMTIYPERLGTPTVLYDGEWPFVISNDIPADYLFAQGDNIVTWTATDPECGNSVSCEQHVVIAFPQCPDAVDYEGNIYHGVRIGCDCWTQRNLESRKYSDGDEIAGKYAYVSWQHPDTAANVARYGRLYSFEAAVRDSADNGLGHIQGICPDGWFLPTPEHYERLNQYGASALRSPDLWLVGAGNNSTGFTALPAGFYNGQIDRYEGLLTETYFWSAQGVGTSVANHVHAITYYCDSVMEQHPMSGLGYSVRCVKGK